MYRQPLTLPIHTLDHLLQRDLEAQPELLFTKHLVEQGWHWHGAVLPPQLEEQFYRLNNLPRQLAALFKELDPRDPDEDIVEEVEEQALALVARHYLLDETIDAIYEVYDRLGGNVVLRRPGVSEGRHATHQRACLLALKDLFKDDWSAQAVLTRLAVDASLAIDARPILLHVSGGQHDSKASQRASQSLGQPVQIRLDGEGRMTHVLPA